MGKEQISTPLEQKAIPELIDPSQLVAAPINITPEVQVKLEGATARGMALLNSSLERRQEKKKELSQPSLNEVDLNVILSKDDNLFYQEKKASYLEAYPDLGNDPFDLDDLHLMIMEQVFQRNLLKRKKKHPNLDITKDYESSVKRQNDFKKSLSMRRADRVKAKQTGGPKINIAKISMSFTDEGKMVEMHRRLESMREEEQGLSNRLKGI